jgi:carboxylesterase type B
VKTTEPRGSVPAANEPLVDSMEGYWTRFGVTGDPNGGTDPMWPAFTTAGDAYLTLDQPISMGTGLHKMACAFWDQLTP